MPRRHPPQPLTTKLDPRESSLVRPQELYCQCSDLQCEDSDTFFVEVKLVYEIRRGSHIPVDQTKWIIAWEITSNPPRNMRKLLFATPSYHRNPDGTVTTGPGMLALSVVRPFIVEGGYWNECKLGRTNLEQRQILEKLAMKTPTSTAGRLVTSPQWVETVLSQAVQKGIFKSANVEDCIQKAKEFYVESIGPYRLSFRTS